MNIRGQPDFLPGYLIQRRNDNDAFSNWNAEDIRYCLWELRKSGYLEIDIFGNVTLLESGTEYMESKPKEFFSAFAETVSGLISLISAFRAI